MTSKQPEYRIMRYRSFEFQLYLKNYRVSLEHTHFRDEKQGVADIFKKKGPFLKLFSSYILNFENITSTFDEALKKYPAFQAAVREF